MKSKNIPITLTQIVLYVLCGVFVIVFLTAPLSFKAFCTLAGYSRTKYIALVVVFYICSPSAGVTVYFTNRFLQFAKKGDVFSKKCIKTVSVLSWACFSAVPLSLPLIAFFYGAFPIPVAAFFTGLILQVVKCVIKEGTDLRTENDLTI